MYKVLCDRYTYSASKVGKMVCSYCSCEMNNTEDKYNIKRTLNKKRERLIG